VAGAGKTTLCELLVLVLNAWSGIAPLELTQHAGTFVACVSMDAYHYSNAILASMGLQSEKVSLWHVRTLQSDY
jgi:pantothenate kinase